MKRSFLTLVLSAAAFAAHAAYPERPITVIVGFPPGSAPDVAARLLTQKLGNRLGQPLVVENRAGAAGTIGAAAVARAPADGYTLLFGSSSSLAVAPALYKNLAFDTLKSFSPVAQAVRGAFILTVRSGLPVKDLKELAAYAKQHPDKLTYGSSGNGSLHHLCMEMFKSAADVSITHVPFKGSPPNWLALNQGQVDMICDSMPNPTATLQAGRGRAIAVSGDQRTEVLPEVATFKEQGYGAVDIEFWYGLLAPAGTPREIVGRLNAEVGAVLRDPEVVAQFKSQSINVVPGSPEEFGRVLQAEVKLWPPVIEKAKVHVD